MIRGFPFLLAVDALILAAFFAVATACSPPEPEKHFLERTEMGGGIVRYRLDDGVTCYLAQHGGFSTPLSCVLRDETHG